MKGKLIVLEGIDGCGKSAVGKRLYEHLTSKGIKCVLYHEPSDSYWGKIIKKRLSIGEIIPTDEQLFLFLLDRASDVTNRIVPTLNSGTTIILDRYYYSTAAYQTQKGLSPKEILSLNILHLNFPKPDLTIWLRIQPDVALERIKERDIPLTQFEALEILTELDRNYDNVFNSNLIKEHVARISAEKSEDEVSEEVIAVVTNFLTF